MPNDIDLNDVPPEEDEDFSRSLENVLEPGGLSPPPSSASPEKAAASPEKQESALQIFQRVRLDRRQLHTELNLS